MASAQYVYRMAVAILWKSWRCRKHHWIRTTFEILAPVILVLLVVTVKTVMKTDTNVRNSVKSETSFAAYDIKGLLVQLCTDSCNSETSTTVLAYSPSNNTFYDSLMIRVKDGMQSKGVNIELKSFKSELEIEGYNSKLANSIPNATHTIILLGAVIFPSKSTINPEDHLVYKLRMVNSKFLTGRLFPEMKDAGPGKQFKEYETSGFLGVQLMIDVSFMELIFNESVPYSIEAKGFPFPAYTFMSKHSFTAVVSTVLPATIVIGFGLMLVLALAEIVEETENGVKSLLTMLGISNWGYWIGWYLNLFITSAISVSVIVPALTMNISGEEPVLATSSPSLMWFIMFSFTQSSICFCFFLSSFFKSSAHIKSLGFLVWISTLIIPAVLIGTEHEYLEDQMLASILPTINLYWCFSVITNWESQGVGAQWANTFDYPNEADSLCISILLVMQFFSSFLFVALTAFVSRCTEDEWELKSPCKLLYDVWDSSLFPCFKKCSLPKTKKMKERELRKNSLKAFWNENYFVGGNDLFTCKPDKNNLNDKISSEFSRDQKMEKLRRVVFRRLDLMDEEGKLRKMQEGIAFEEFEHDPEASVIVKNLYKEIHGRKVMQSFTCDFHPNEITAIFGRAGSGKTTLFNTITGMLQLENGKVYVNTYDISEYLMEARRTIGVCPQTNMLFDELTVAEHVIMFAWLKGMNHSEAGQDAKRLMRLLDIKSFSKTAVKDLPSDIKRRVSIAVAACGNPKIVLLDDPFGTVDVTTKRAIFNVLRELKKQKRAVIFTTSSYEEAQMFSTRVGILCRGRLQCFGSPSYLKSYFGNLLIIKFNIGEKGVNSLLGWIQRNIPSYDFKTRRLDKDGEVIIISVPDRYFDLLAEIFDNLKEEQWILHINEISIRRQSIEESFDSISGGPVLFTEPETAVQSNAETLNKRKQELHRLKLSTVSSARGRLKKLDPNRFNSSGWQIDGDKPENIESYIRHEILFQLEMMEGEDEWKKQLELNSLFKWSKETEDCVLEERHAKLNVTEELSIEKQQTGCRLVCARFTALMKKLHILTTSNTFCIGFQFFIPLLLITSGIVGANLGFQNDNKEHFSETNLYFRSYKEPVTVYAAEDTNIAYFYEKAVQTGEFVPSQKVSKTILEIGIKDYHKYSRQCIVGMKQHGDVITAMFSTVPHHAAPMSVNLVSNALLKLMNSSTSRRISISNHPMNNGSTNPLDDVGKEGLTTIAMSLSFYFSFALAVICAFVSVKPFKERLSGSHHLQMMSGINPCTFWMSYYVYDGIYIAVFSCMSMMMVTVVEDRYLFSSNYGEVALFLILFIGGLMCLSFTYFVNHVIKHSVVGFSWFNMFQVFVGLGSYMVYTAHDGVSDGLTYLFYWLTAPLPIPLTVHALYTYSKIVIMNSPCNRVSKAVLKTVCNSNNDLLKELPSHLCCRNCKKSSSCFQTTSFFYSSGNTRFTDYTILQDIYVMLGVSAIYFFFLIMEDLLVFKRLNRFFMGAPAEAFARYEEFMDDSALKERNVVKTVMAKGNMELGIDGIIVDGISKNYGPIAALSNVSCSVERGNCLAMLGLDGAGKSSLLKIITGEEIPTVGNVYIYDDSLLDGRMNYMSNIGYCPHNIAVLEDLTGRELLMLYGMLRGVKSANLHSECSKWLVSLDLENYADRRIKNLSKSKRRLISIAVALVGLSSLLVIDEPSSAVDATDCQALWRTIKKYQQEWNPVLITSNNVEECEALCERVGLLVNGVLEFIGDAKSIKAQFVKGFVLTLYLNRYYYKDNPQDVEGLYLLREILEDHVENVIFKETYDNVMKFVIPGDELNWKKVFQSLRFISDFGGEVIQSFKVDECTFTEILSALLELDNSENNKPDLIPLNCLQNCVLTCMSGNFCHDDYA